MVEQKDVITVIAGVAGTVTSLSLALVGILATANVPEARKRDVKKLAYVAFVSLALALFTTLVCVRWLYRKAPGSSPWPMDPGILSADAVYQVAWVSFVATCIAIVFMSVVTVLFLRRSR
jgi:hypothetical protein